MAGLLCSCSTQQIGPGPSGVPAAYCAAGVSFLAARSRTSSYMKVPPLDSSQRLTSITALLIEQNWEAYFPPCPSPQGKPFQAFSGQREKMGQRSLAMLKLHLSPNCR